MKKSDAMNEQVLRFDAIGEPIHINNVQNAMEQIKKERDERNKKIKIIFEVLKAAHYPTRSTMSIYEEIAANTGISKQQVIRIILA